MIDKKNFIFANCNIRIRILRINHMKKIVLALVLVAVSISCASKMDKAMKSADKNFILQTADEYYAKKKWKNALALYDRLPNLVVGTDDGPNVLFKSAYANYYQKAYRLAGHQFKNFGYTFSKDPRAEEASYMSALCYYEGSMDYNLDQTDTESAINELQNFLNAYPNSERAKNINTLIDELSYKIEFKAYENARQYFKMGEYKASNHAFENVLNDFPSTKLRPKIYDFMMKSQYQLAVNSMFDLKKERIDNAIAFSKTIEKELPGTGYAKDAVEMRTKLVKEDANYQVQLKQIEAKRKILSEKQKREEERQAKIQKTEEQLREQVQAEKKANQILRDSAQLATPPPAATFKIKR